MRRAAVLLAVLLTTTAAQAQNTLYPPHKFVVDPEGEAPLYRRTMLPPDGWMPPDQRRLMALSTSIVPPKLAPALEPVVILGDFGGNVGNYHARWWRVAAIGNAVEIRGGCFSACTLVVSHIPKERLCVANGGFLAFHMAWKGNDEPSPDATLEMFESYPDEIRTWINRNGGPLKLPKLAGNAYWTMYDRELWAIGYPRCK